MTQPRTRDPELTRTAILDAAEDLFIEKGLGHTSLSEIARRAGITKSLIHHHFESKQLLWQEVKRRAFQAYTEQQTALLQTSELTLDTLSRSIATYFRFLKSNPKIIRLMAWMALEEPELREDFCVEEELIAFGVQRVRDGQEIGLLRRDIPPSHVVIAFLAMSHAWFQERHHFAQCLAQDSEAVSDIDGSDEQFLESAVKIIIAGARAHDE
jgi:TetR/AcrR family transcriptional regulator